MIKRVVMFKLSNKNEENVSRLVKAIRGLEHKIDSIRFMEVVENISDSEKSYDVLVHLHFDNKQGLSQYATHSDHLPVIELAQSLCQHTVLVDYES